MSPATISGHDLLPPRRLVRNDTANEQRAVDSALTYMHDISAKMRKLSVADVAPGTAEEQETRALLENIFNNGEE